MSFINGDGGTNIQIYAVFADWSSLEERVQITGTTVNGDSSTRTGITLNANSIDVRATTDIKSIPRHLSSRTVLKTHNAFHIARKPRIIMISTEAFVNISSGLYAFSRIACIYF